MDVASFWKQRNFGNERAQIQIPFFDLFLGCISDPYSDHLSSADTAISDTCSDAGNEKHLKQIDDLQSKLEKANAELVEEKEKAQKLAAENEKLQYRIIHLSQALKESNKKLDQFTACSSVVLVPFTP
ncbi:hypothetical protein K1719_040331 [Acacia pycnantha]|nr:hypothetical protein K1719_040331 [Acacia pycnantha]